MSFLGDDVLTDVEKAEASTEFAPIPAGEYVARVTRASIKPTKSGGGEYVALELTVLGPQYQGRKLFDNLNTRNANRQAQEIGIRKFKSLVLACGYTEEDITTRRFNDTDQLLNHTCTVKVSIEPAKGEYPERNIVKSYSKDDGAAFGGGDFSSAFGAPMEAEKESAPFAF